MHVVGSALFSHVEPNVNLVLAQAHFAGTTSARGIVPPITVNCGVTQKYKVDCFVEPVKGKQGKSFEGSLRKIWRREWDSHLAFLYVSCLQQHTAITLINQGPCVSPLVEILTIGTCIEQISDVYRHQPTPTNFKCCCSYNLNNK